MAEGRALGQSRWPPPAPRRGDLDDLDALRAAAAASDGVIHLAFKHGEAFSGRYEEAAAAERRAIETFGAALAGSDRPLVIASGMAGHTPGRVITEDDRPDPDGPAGHRALSERTALALAASGVRSSSLRLPPTVHGEGDPGFLATLVRIACESGVSGYPGDGSNRRPAVHRLDAARAFRLALERAAAGSVVHAVAEDGVPLRMIAEAIGRRFGPPWPRSTASTSAGSAPSSRSTSGRRAGSRARGWAGSRPAPA